MSWDHRAGLVVVGAGMAGLTAAAAAARSGVEVVVVEKAEAIGGSAALSGGFFWTMRDLTLMRELIPDGDPELQRAVIDDYPKATAWLESMGAMLGPQLTPSNVPAGVGHLFDNHGYLHACCRAVEAAGGVVLVAARVTDLVTTGDRVVGVVIEDRDGTSRIGSDWILLATGGFQADPILRADYLGAQARDVLLRSNPCSTGDGLLLGRSVGATTTASMTGFYGHPIATPRNRPFIPGDFARLSQSSYAPFAVLLDRTGRRFVDESRGHPTQVQAMIDRPAQRAVLVADERLRRMYATRAQAPGVEVIDRPAEAAASGARVARADTLAGLAHRIAAWGYPESVVVASVEQFNRGVTTAAPMAPGRRTHRAPLDEAPYFAVEVEPSITFTHGGLRIDAQARVLRENGAPVPGLLAAGVDGAGVHCVGYAGGLATGAVFGLRAAALVASTRA
ncbi:FAD-dependent oxidoreductase [Rhodococcus sp. T2V]|uniref:FAD-dependent oxidoreductase n=1 Tax=Rhodococcus sp. T2V TaxID=3034164 RepID=UPI0023E2F59B|nr:FAD-dependent oxidoreductase [Rhodococcus sp. T2V]MDF3310068.1 FAD-dependent oxidoreductase [Rhodococcus sp. T2V]